MNKFNRISNYSYHIVNNLSKKPESFIYKSNLLKLNKLNKEEKILHSSNFILNELPIRFSRRIKELEELPLDLSKNHEIFKIRDWYLKSLDEITLLNFPKNLDNCEDIKSTVESIYIRHSDTLNTMSEGINKLKSQKLISNNIDFFLTNFYYNRTKTRFLIKNYLDYFNNNSEYIGSLSKKCNIHDIIKDAVSDIEFLSEYHRYEKPNIKINIDQNFNYFLYDKDYLNYCIVEILKNSLVAVQKIESPLIEVSCLQDKNMIILKISDNGLGIDKTNLEKIWNFSFTTSDIDFNNNTIPLSGFGYGLPITKILLKTFEGDVKVFSKKNIGTDVYIIIDLNSNWKF